MTAGGRQEGGTRLVTDAHGNRVVIWCRCRREQWPTPCQTCADEVRVRLCGVNFHGVPCERESGHDGRHLDYRGLSDFASPQPAPGPGARP